MPSSATLALLVALACITLVLPTFNTRSAGPTFSGSQLVFAGVLSLALCAALMFGQTVRYRDCFFARAGRRRPGQPCRTTAPPHHRTTVLQRAVRLVRFAVFLLLAVVPRSPGQAAAQSSPGDGSGTTLPNWFSRP